MHCSASASSQLDMDLSLKKLTLLRNIAWPSQQTSCQTVLSAPFILFHHVDLFTNSFMFYIPLTTLQHLRSGKKKNNNKTSSAKVTSHPQYPEFKQCCCCSVTKSCLTLCNPIDCSTWGFPVLHYLLEFAQTHVHWVSDAIQPFHSPLPPALNLSQHQGLFQWVGSQHQMAKVFELQVAQRLKRLPAVRETRVQSLGWEDPLEKEMATHSSTLVWRIPWREEPGRLQSMGSQTVGHDWVTSLSLSASNPPMIFRVDFL